MSPHQERVITERKELFDKMEKLQIFILGEVFKSLDQDEQVRLRLQLEYMRLYYEVLTHRTGAFKEN